LDDPKPGRARSLLSQTFGSSFKWNAHIHAIVTRVVFLDYRRPSGRNIGFRPFFPSIPQKRGSTFHEPATREAAPRLFPKEP
jgi:hypothetical protein